MKPWIVLVLLMATPVSAQGDYVQRSYRLQCNFDNLIGKGRDEVQARCGANSHHLQFGPARLRSAAFAKTGRTRGYPAFLGRIIVRVRHLCMMGISERIDPAHCRA
jgi:hypothetical protein